MQVALHYPRQPHESPQSEGFVTAPKPTASSWKRSFSLTSHSYKVPPTRVSQPPLIMKIITHFSNRRSTQNADFFALLNRQQGLSGSLRALRQHPGRQQSPPSGAGSPLPAAAIFPPLTPFPPSASAQAQRPAGRGLGALPHGGRRRARPPRAAEGAGGRRGRAGRCVWRAAAWG